MWVIVGLGNPGDKYAKTRHNIGFRVIDQLSEIYNIPLRENNMYAIGRGAIKGHEVILLKPLTFMNRSGLVVRDIFRRFNISTDKLLNALIVIHDDIDLDIGIIKIKRNGTSGGHRGIESVIQEIRTKDFVRIKVGIGRDKDIPVEEYVLRDFRLSEKNLIKDVIIKSVDAAAVIVTEGIEKAMNTYN